MMNPAESHGQANFSAGSGPEWTLQICHQLNTQGTQRSIYGLLILNTGCIPHPQNICFSFSGLINNRHRWTFWVGDSVGINAWSYADSLQLRSWCLHSILEIISWSAIQ